MQYTHYIRDIKQAMLERSGGSQPAVFLLSPGSRSQGDYSICEYRVTTTCWV